MNILKNGYMYESPTSPVFLGQVREAPDVAEPDSVADGGEDEGDLGVPRLALLAALVPRQFDTDIQGDHSGCSLGVGDII